MNIRTRRGMAPLILAGVVIFILMLIVGIIALILIATNPILQWGVVIVFAIFAIFIGAALHQSITNKPLFGKK
jgi:uncharacterized membrane protein YqjE